MADRVKVTITGFYYLPDSMDLRVEVYGTTDPATVAAADARTDPVDLLATCHDITLNTKLVTEDSDA